MAESTSQNQSAALRQISVDAPRYSGYTSLDTSRREIRLLDIDAELHCRLRTVSLDDKPPYSALSYYWGSPSATVGIAVNGQTVHLRKTLHTFLKTLIEVHDPRTVWLDVLCINQRDFSEQSSQVAMMGDIYIQAQNVYAWLGQGEPDPQYALSYVNSSLDEREAYEQRLVLAGIEQLCFNPYFTRVWIMQECLLNAKVFMMSGIKVADFDSMIQAFETLVSSGTVAIEATKAWTKVNGMFGMREDLRRGKRKPLLQVINLFASQRCQDPRDSIYGFQALSQDGHRLQVDYRSEPIDILIQVISRRNWDCFVSMTQLSQDPMNYANAHMDLGWYLDPGYIPKVKESGRHFNLTEEFRELLERLRIPENQIVKGLKDSASDWLVHRVGLVKPSRLDSRVLYALERKGGIFDRPPASLVYNSLMRKLVPRFNAHIHSVYISFGWDLLVTVNDRNGDVLAAMSGARQLGLELERHKAWSLERAIGLERPESLGADLQMLLSRMARRHVWPCRITFGLHTSRLFLVALSNIRRGNKERWATVKALLTRHGNLERHDDPDAAIGKCNCKRLDDLPSLEPPPWNVP